MSALRWWWLLLGLSLPLVGCGQEGGAPAPRGGPNVLLVTLDTTRADRLGCYGYEAAETPTLDGLAAAGVRFENAYCQVPLTLPSHATILTGLTPPSTGLRVNGSGALAGDIPTLAERFQARGYRTAAFIASEVLSSRHGLDRGFGHYDDDFDRAAAQLWLPERRADKVCDAVIAWLSEAPAEPFFVWVHFFDPHLPYDPPPGFAERFADPYDGEIAFMDAQLGRLLDWLESRGLRDQALIVAAGDHGEAFGEHGEQEHGLLLYDTTLRVPLIFAWPGKLPAGRVVTGGARLIDLAPTILDLLGFEPLPEAQGVSLRAALVGQEDAWRPIYSETDYPLVGFGWASLRAYATERWKYIAAPRPELYDRENDPAEATNLAAEQPETARKLATELERLMTSLPQRQAEQVGLDSKTLRALESLGYAGAGAGAVEPAANIDRRDPKDMTAVVNGFMRAKGLALGGEYQQAISILEPLVARSPESDELFATLGFCYLKVGRYYAAEKALNASLRTVPNNPLRLCHLGDAIAAQDRVQDALRCYQKALAADERCGPALSRLGRYYFQRGRYDKAREYLERCLAVEPDSPTALVNMAQFWMQTGQPGKAVPLLRRALEREPTHALAHQGLWLALDATGQRQAAIAALREACRVLSDDVRLQRSLVELLATTPQLEPAGRREALTVAQRLVGLDPGAPENLAALALANAANGAFGKACTLARQALELARAQGKSLLAEQLRARLEAYEAGRIR